MILWFPNGTTLSSSVVLEQSGRFRFYLVYSVFNDKINAFTVCEDKKRLSVWGCANLFETYSHILSFLLVESP
jgi:hypothetical protein